MFSVSILKQNLNVFKPYMKDSHYTTMCGQLEFLIDNIIVMFGGRVFQHSRYSYGYHLCSSSRRLVPFKVHEGAFQEKRQKLAPSFSCMFCNTDDVIALNNIMLGDYVDLIYSIGLK